MPALLTLQEGADRAHVSFPTIRRWVDAGLLPVFRVGKVVRVSETDLAAFIESRYQVGRPLDLAAGQAASTAARRQLRAVQAAQ